MQRRRINSRSGRGKGEDSEKAAPPITPERAMELTMQRAGKLLAAKPRSVAELRDMLLEKRWTNETIVEEVLQKLRGYGYLNDEQFAFGFASYRVRQRPIGRQRLARDLQLKKVDRETADEALRLVFEETPEEELIDRAIKKRTRLRGLPRTRPEIKSFIEHLLRLGFPYELVTSRVRAISKADFEEDDLP